MSQTREVSRLGSRETNEQSNVLTCELNRADVDMEKPARVSVVDLRVTDASMGVGPPANRIFFCDSRVSAVNGKDIPHWLAAVRVTWSEFRTVCIANFPVVGASKTCNYLNLRMEANLAERSVTLHFDEWSSIEQMASDGDGGEVMKVVVPAQNQSTPPEYETGKRKTSAKAPTVDAQDQELQSEQFLNPPAGTAPASGLERRPTVEV